MASTKRSLGIAAIGAGLLFMGTANAWWGTHWYRPYGSGAMTYERQNMMRDHGYSMRELANMLEGRRAFNRGEAVRFARELEAGFDDSLIGNYAPGSWAAGSRTLPWTWDHFGAFKGYAEAARQSSARLAEALNTAPTSQDMQQKGVWIPSPRLGHGRPGHQRGDLISLEAVQEYGRLNATCHSCHMLFRGSRW